MARGHLTRLQHRESDRLAFLFGEVQDCDWSLTLLPTALSSPPSQRHTVAPDCGGEASGTRENFKKTQLPKRLPGYTPLKSIQTPQGEENPVTIKRNGAESGPSALLLDKVHKHGSSEWKLPRVLQKPM